jgi:hypothetical protein
MIQFSGGNSDFLPGEKIAGGVQWGGGIQEDCERIEIRLIWYTHGKGDRDFGIADSKTVASVPDSGRIDFEFVAPHRPYSFTGKIVSLTWAIEAVTFPGMNAEQLGLTITPARQEIIIKRHAVD